MNVLAAEEFVPIRLNRKTRVLDPNGEFSPSDRALPAEQVQHSANGRAGILKRELSAFCCGGNPGAQLDESLDGGAVDFFDLAEIEGDFIDWLIEVANQFSLQGSGVRGFERRSVEGDEQLARLGQKLNSGGHGIESRVRMGWIRENKYQ